ncbi:hypothetical protein ABMB67_000434 [Halalkalibacter oceani]
MRKQSKETDRKPVEVKEEPTILESINDYYSRT